MAMVLITMMDIIREIAGETMVIILQDIIMNLIINSHVIKTIMSIDQLLDITQHAYIMDAKTN